MYRRLKRALGLDGTDTLGAVRTETAALDVDSNDSASDRTALKIGDLKMKSNDFREILRGLVEIGRTLNIMREELSLVYSRPAGAGAGGAAAVESGEAAIFRDYVAATRMKEVYPTDLFPRLENVALPIAAINEESGHTNQVDLLYVSAIAQARGARDIFEFGTYQGRTTYFLTFASPEARVTTLNLPPARDPGVAAFLGIMFKGSDRENRITEIHSDSREFDPNPYTGRMDYIFVDGDHSYEMVKNDTEKALVMLKPGGMIVWHDYAAKSPGVVRYIREFAEQRPVFRLKHTCLVVYIDGVDSLAFEPPPRRPSWVSLG
jgi:predicted O-methyltransferase YrrM